MTNYFVRKTGSDGNAGTSAGAAWLTIGKALTSGGVAAGDTVYIGAGIYRETVTASLTNPASEVKFVGDVDGAYTGDPGEVSWSAWTTNDTTSGSSSALLAGGSKNNLTFEKIGFFSSGTGMITGLGTGWTFRSCLFFSVTNGVNHIAVTITAALNLTIDGCISVVNGNSSNHVAVTCTQSASAEYQTGIVVKNSVFHLGNAILNLGSTGAQAFKGGGGKVLNCTAFGCILAVVAAGNSAQYPILVLNCMAWSDTTLTSESAIGGIVAENVRSVSASNAVEASAGIFNTGIATGRAPYGEYGQSILWGLTPRPFLSPTSIAFSATGALGVSVQTSPTATDDATVGSISWTNVTDASPGDTNALATATSIPATTGISHYIKVLGGVAVPAGATIKGVRVDVSAKAGALSAIAASSVKLVKAGTISGNEGASFNTGQFTTSLNRGVWRSTSDPLWGNTLTDTDVNDAGFGCVIALKNTSGSTVTADVDYVRVIVSWQLDTDTTQLQATDLLGRPRPSGLNQTGGQIGAYEVHDYGTKEASVTHGGAAALKLTGPGDQQFDVPVDAVSTTISIYGRYDSTHGSTNKPQLTVLDAPDIGVSTATATMTAAADTWEQISLTFTPSAKGIVTIRLKNRAAAASGLAYFDDLAVT